LGSVTPALIIIVMVIAAVSMTNPSVPMSDVGTYTDITKTPTGIWWLEAITYSGIVLAMAFSILSIVGAHSSFKVAERGGLSGGVSQPVLQQLMSGGCVSQVDVTSTVELPTRVLAREIHPLLALALAIVMLLIIYNTAVGMLDPFLTKFWTPYSRKYKVALVVSLIAGYFLSLVGFVDLVYFFYPILGYLGIAIA